MSFYENYEGDFPEEIIPGVRIVRATGKACIVCGDSSGDCTSKNYDGPNHIVTLGKDEKLAEIDMYTVTEDIWEERPITSTTTSKFLVARKGRQISRKKAKELGII